MLRYFFCPHKWPRKKTTDSKIPAPIFLSGNFLLISKQQQTDI